jgi:hypothetical protein
MIRCIVLTVLLASSATAQQRPCADAELKAAAAEAQLAASQVQMELLKSRIKTLEAETGKRTVIETRTIENTQKLIVLEAKIAEQQRLLDAKDKTITILVAENVKARRWKTSFLRVFGFR